jgi:hypothetical protein
MTVNRRGFLVGIGAALAAPAIVRFESLMPVRNRLWQQSSLYVPDLQSFQTFSCYVKSGNDLPLHLSDNPGAIQQTLNDYGRGWYRYIATLPAGEEINLKLPSDKLWGAQLEYGKGGATQVKLSGPNGGDDGVLILPTFERDWPPGLV